MKLSLSNWSRLWDFVEDDSAYYLVAQKIPVPQSAIETLMKWPIERINESLFITTE